MKTKATLFLALAILLLAFAPIMAVTNFGAVHISDANPTGVPALKVNQIGAGKIVEFSDGGTPVWSLSNGGGVTNSGVQTFTGLLNANGGIAVDTSAFTVADSSGNTVVSGTLTVSSTTDLNGALDMSAQPITNIGNAGTDFGTNGSLTTAQTVTVSAGNVNITAGNLAIGNGSPSVAQDGEDAYVEGRLEVDGATRIDGTTEINANVDADSISVAGNADLTTVNNSGGDLAINDNVDITGTLQYGADNLSPLGYAGANQQMVCGTTVTFTGTHLVEPTGLTTTTYPIVVQITQPAATAAFLTVTAPTTAAFTIQSWGADYNAGTTGITAHWCALGDQ